MMSCSDVRPILSLFLEKETGPMETLEARRHLDRCDACSGRARRLSGVLSACAALPERAPDVDVASTVMERLRAMRNSMASGARGTGLAARWSGLAVFIGVGLALLARAEEGQRGPIARSIDYLAALLGGREAPGSSDLAGGLLMTALRLVGGGFRAQLPAGTGFDLVMVLQLTATALLIGLLLSLPVAALTAWFLRSEARRRDLTRL